MEFGRWKLSEMTSLNPGIFSYPVSFSEAEPQGNVSKKSESQNSLLS